MPTAPLRLLVPFCVLGISLSAQPAPDQPPGAPLLPESALPEYEKDIDHAGLIRGWNAQSLARGRELYQQICQNCHGDLHVPGSLPTSLRFGQGVFQHGNDPHTIYQTLTRGWRLMSPQVDLVPQEKYDVIHYLREHFLKESNPSQWFAITPDYLDRLPKGSGRGPAPIKREPWREMDYGDFLIGTFEIMSEERRQAKPPPRSPPDYVAPDANLAYKAIALRLDPGPGGVSRGSTWLAFEHDTLRVAGVWTGEGFIDWRSINFNGQHVVRPRTIGTLLAETADAPGWADPATGRFDDPRLRGLDQRRYGPLPRAWARYRGLYRHGSRTVIAYTIGDSEVLESHDLRPGSPPSVIRTLNIGKSSRDLAVRLGNAGTALALRAPAGVTRHVEDGFEVVRIPAALTPLKLAAAYGAPSSEIPEPADLTRFTRGGASQWPDKLETPVIRGAADGPFAVDSFALPARTTSPSKSWMRTTGLDFTPDGDTAILCTWDGDVWRVEGIGAGKSTVTWRRIAAGLFQPLGLKIVNGDIFVTCRDQIVRLRDLNGDHEADVYECFNSDHQVTEHFHEFAMGLQVDAAGNFYYAKSARHARTALVPQHGTLLKVSADGARTEILANGFRAANGVCLNPDGSFIVTDQEGFWMPMNRINWVTPGGFYGNMWSYGAPDDARDEAMLPPLTWIDKRFDRSPAELLWVPPGVWGPLQGSLINLSYGRGKIEVVPHESVGGLRQGGVVMLPIPEFPTGIMRGRFHPRTGHLYLCGMSAWATDQLHMPGGFYRIATTGKPMHVPVGLKARQGSLDIEFSDPLDAASLAEKAKVTVSTWSLVRSERYGSPRQDVKQLTVAGLRLLPDGRTLRLTLPEIAPVWQMEIAYELPGSRGETVRGTMENTIHRLGTAAP